MDPVLLTLFLALAVLLVLSAFFSSAETALFSIGTIELHRVRARSERIADRLTAILDHPARLLSAILIGNTVVNVVASIVGYTITERLFPRHGEWLAVVVMTVLLLLLGEITPKRLAIRFAVPLSCAYARPLAWIIRAAYPAHLLLEQVTNWFRHHIAARPRHLTEDEFLSAVSMSEEAGVLDEEERSMVDGIVRLADLQASEVMTPRVDLIGIDIEDDPATYIDTARKAKVHYLPIYEGDLDHVVGFLDVLGFLLAPEPDWKKARIPVRFVPETVTLDKLLQAFQREDIRVAIVADEYGGTAGLVTLGDVLEEIVDEVEDEVGEDDLTLEAMGPNRWLVEGDTSLETINYELDLNLEADGADRISGWIAAQLGHIPRPGEGAVAQGCRVTVQRVRRTRVTLVMLEKLPTPPEELS